MPLTDADLQTIEGLIAAKLDLASAFRELPDNERELIAEDIERFLYFRAPHLRKPENFYTPRITVGDADINLNESSVLKGHAGPTLPRWINFVSGSGTLDNEDFAKVNLNLGSGADCMFDYLVSSCFATLPGFSAGQTFTSLSGCTFRGYSTIQGAVTAAGALGASDSSTVFVCRGTYAEQVVAAQGSNSALRIIGSGQGNTTIQPTNAMSGIALDLDNIASDAGIIEVEGITVDTTVMSGAGIGIRFLSPSRARIQNCRVVGVSGDTGVQATSASSTAGIWFDNVNFSGAITGVTLGDSCTGHFINCAFETNVVNGIVVSHNAQGSADHCLFTTNTIGVSFTSTSRNFEVTNSTFFNCTDGISAIASSGWPHNVLIEGNQFISCSDGIDFSGLVGDCEGINITGNQFFDTSTNVGIRLHSTRFKNSIVANNTFSGGVGDTFTSGNEIVGMTQAQATTANTQIIHNTTDSGATLVDTHGTLGATHSDLMTTATPATLSSDTLTITARPEGITHYVIRGEGNANDDLLNITPTSDNDWITIRPGGSEFITVPNSGGNIKLPAGVTAFVLTSSEQFLYGWYNPLEAKWTLFAPMNYLTAIADDVDGSGITAELGRLTITGVMHWVANNVTIASDQISTNADGNTLRVAGQGGAADDLDGMTMVGGNAVGMWVILTIADAADPITIKHDNAGGTLGSRFYTQTGSDIVLDDLTEFALCVYTDELGSGNGGWAVMTNVPGAGATALEALYEIPADSQTLTAGSETTTLLDYGFANALTYTIEESTGGAGDTGFSGIVMQPDLTFSHDSAAIWMYGVLWNPQIIANGIDFDISAAFVNDARYLIDGTSTFGITYGHVDHPQFKTSGGTTTTMSEYNGFASLGQREIDAGWTITTYRDFYVKTDTADAGTIATKIGLDIEAFNEGTTQIGIQSAEQIRMISGAGINMWSGGVLSLYSNTGTTATGSWDGSTGLFRLLGSAKTYTADTNLMSCTSDIELGSPAGAFSFYTSQNQITYKVANSFAFMFHHNSTHQVNTAVAAPIPLVFADRGTIQTNAQTQASAGYASFYSAPSTVRAGGSGALTVSELQGFQSAVASIGANTTVTMRTGADIANITTNSGTLVHQIGVRIRALSGATTNNVGISNEMNYRGVGYLAIGMGTTAVGSNNIVNAPANTTNGDLNALRAWIGTNAAISGTAILSVAGGPSDFAHSTSMPSNPAAGYVRQAMFDVAAGVYQNVPRFLDEGGHDSSPQMRVRDMLAFPLDSISGPVGVVPSTTLGMTGKVQHHAPITVASIVYNIAGAGTVAAGSPQIRVAIYTEDGTLITGTNATDTPGTATGLRTVTLGTPVYLPGGNYFYFVCADHPTGGDTWTTVPTISMHNTAGTFNAAGATVGAGTVVVTTGDAPSPLGTITTTTDRGPMFFLLGAAT